MEFVVYRKGREVAIFQRRSDAERFVRSKNRIFLVNRMLTIILNKEVVI